MGRHSSVLESIAAGGGPVVRIHLRDTDLGTGTELPVNKPSSPQMPALDSRGSRFRLLGEIARGGMGAILKGRDEDLGRDLAVKVLLEQHRQNPDLIRRFVEEAQIGGQLQHPGIVPIYELGTFADRRPYFAMKLVKGHTLAELLAARQPTFSPQEKVAEGRMREIATVRGTHEAEAAGKAAGSTNVELTRPDPEQRGSDKHSDLPRFLSIFEAVCQTVAYAHARGVIHRDLKPSNVMVGSFGEVQVMDWGLAKVLPRGGVVDDAKAGHERAETVIATARSGSDSDAHHSHAGSVMGTPAYMAPEQARGEVDRVDERADVFALGSILGEILTGQPAFTGRNSGEIQRKAALGDIRDALTRLDSCGADLELVRLAKDCLAREREDRPTDAASVTKRVTTYLSDVQARMRRAELASVEERARRRLTTVVAASLLALSTTCGLGFTYWLHQRQAGAARVALALKEATLLRDQAIEIPDDPTRWPAALEGLERAEAALSDGGDPTARRQLAALRAQVQEGTEAAERDRVLLATLDDIRSARADDHDGSATDSAYAAAFRDASFDVANPDPQQAATQITARPESVRRAVVAALDHWTAVRRARGAKGAAWPKLVAVARAADADPDRDALRAALAVEEKARRLEQIRPLVEQANPSSWAPASLVLLASTLSDAGEVDAGVRVLRRASGVFPTDASVHYNLGLLLQRTNPQRSAEAIEAYAAARALRPELGHELAHALADHGRGEEAEAVYRDLVNRRPGQARHLACLAVQLMNSGRDADAAPILDRAVDAARIAIRRRPHDADAHNTLGLVLCDGKQDYPAAEAAFREAIRIDIQYANAHHNLAVALAGQGKLDAAIAEDREAIRLQPDYVEAHRSLGIELGDQGKVEEAIFEYRTAIRLMPDYGDSHYDLGLVLATQGKIDEAIAEFRETIRLKPDDAMGYASLGGALAEQGDHGEALANFRTAVRINPSLAQAHFCLGLATIRQGRFQDAAVSFREAIRLKPDFAEAHSYLGIILSRQQKLDEAIAELRQAFHLNPHLTMVLNQLAWLLLTVADSELRNPAEALELARKAVAMAPNDGNLVNTLALAEYRNGNLGASIAASEHSIELRKGGDAYDWFVLALAFARKGEPEAARTWFDKAVAWAREKDRQDPFLPELWTEAAEALGLPGPAADPKPAGTPDKDP
jgi:serine/threonine-protein kinase